MPEHHMYAYQLSILTFVTTTDMHS